jgi:hypothetical protein
MRVVLTCPVLHVDVISNPDSKPNHMFSLAPTPSCCQVACPACGERHSWFDSRPRIRGEAKPTSDLRLDEVDRSKIDERFLP